MRRILFVGAPFGGFFRSVAEALEARGITVWRIVFEGGDFLETPRSNRIIYKGAQDAFRAFVERTVREKNISAIVTFNDCCPRTSVAIDVARDMNVAPYVIENGYLRPWWVTFDREGVNGNSPLPRDPEFYLRQQSPSVPVVKFKNSFLNLVRDTITHYAANIAMAPVLPYDPSYYGDSATDQAAGYTREYLWRKTHSERATLRLLRRRRREGTGKIFVALMQKPGDAQLRQHSSYRANNPYLREVFASFAAHADQDATLVIKQHPLDYGVEKSVALCQELIEAYGLHERVVYIRKITIEEILELVHGLVTVNSTGGLASIQRLIPTIALGTAIYDMDGITCQGGLDAFWRSPAAPRADVVDAFLNYLTDKTQINGGFHTRRSRAMLAASLAEILSNGAWAPHHDLIVARKPRLGLAVLGGTAKGLQPA